MTTQTNSKISISQDEIEKHLNSLIPEVREVLNRSEEERIRYLFTKRFIKYPKASEILDYMELLISIPKQTRP
jgi:hypothetical protein